jgi:hypothetical protein
MTTYHRTLTDPECQRIYDTERERYARQDAIECAMMILDNAAAWQYAHHLLRTTINSEPSFSIHFPAFARDYGHETVDAALDILCEDIGRRMVDALVTSLRYASCYATMRQPTRHIVREICDGWDAIPITHRGVRGWAARKAGATFCERDYADGTIVAWNSLAELKADVI